MFFENEYITKHSRHTGIAANKKLPTQEVFPAFLRFFLEKQSFSVKIMYIKVYKLVLCLFGGFYEKIYFSARSFGSIRLFGFFSRLRLRRAGGLGQNRGNWGDRDGAGQGV